MNDTRYRKSSLFMLIVAFLAATAVNAEKPAWAGGGKHGQSERGHKIDRDQPHEGRDDGRRGSHDHGGPHGGVVFDGRQRSFVYDYYAGEFGSGHCPPGLAKKHNGCMPPGQARKWAMGRPLPRDVVVYDLPPIVMTEIGLPPPGYRYVRVANDILMIGIGTGFVVYAIMNLGGIH